MTGSFPVHAVLSDRPYHLTCVDSYAPEGGGRPAKKFDEQLAHKETSNIPSPALALIFLNQMHCRNEKYVSHTIFDLLKSEDMMYKKRDGGNIPRPALSDRLKKG